MSCRKPSYWTLRRKAKSWVDRDLGSIQAEGAKIIDAETEVNAQIDENNGNDDDSESMNCQSAVCDNDLSYNTDDLFFQCDDCDDSGTESESELDSLRDELAKWAVQHHITHSAVNGLLDVLGKHHPILPKDARTLLSTARSHDISIQEKAGGQYHYFGVLQSITPILQNNKGLLSNTRDLKLQVNIDGLPLFKSSTTQLWPILGTLLNIPHHEPVTIGLFCGERKPNSPNVFLEDFAVEVAKLAEGFDFDGVRYTVQLSSMVCDAPARAFIKCIKGHTGYHGCEKCTQDGVYIDSRMTYPRTDPPLRTDQSFKEKTDLDHHHGISALEKTALGMVSGFPLDYMHLVCLGVMRRLLHLWLKLGPLSCRLSGFQVNVLSEKLLDAQSYVPVEFARRPRALREIDRWKATEFRQFLLYTGPVLLKDVLNTEVYHNFLLLFVGIFILSNSLLLEDYLEYANNILGLFVCHFGELYGPKFVSYNVHNLVHLAQDVQNHGILDSFSAFQYENHLSKMKRMIRKPSNPLSQIVKRLSEVPQRECPEKKANNVLGQTISGPLPAPFYGATQHKKLVTPQFTIKLDQANSYIYLEGNVVKVKNIIFWRNEVFLAYSRFEQHESFFDYPLPSSTLNIYLVHGLGRTMHFCKADQIEGKAFLIPYKHKFVSIPLLHAKTQ